MADASLKGNVDAAAACLDRAAVACLDRQGARPAAAALVDALLTLEQGSKAAPSRAEPPLALDALVGTWRLLFVTGTKTSRQRAGVVLGPGRYLPPIPTIAITYDRDRPDNPRRGRTTNTVTLGPISLALDGPVETMAGRMPILAFDFTHLTLRAGALNLYQRDLRGGRDRDATFSDVPLKDRPFFTYFWTSDRAIAARGRGGGLALWGR